MNIYFDTEFTGLYKNADLISIGMISDTEKELYLEFNDIYEDEQNDWIKENVLANTIYYGNKNVYDIVKDENDYFQCNKKQARNIIINYLEQFNAPIQLISDVCHYDMMLFIDIFGSAFDIPSIISPVCHDINQDLAKYCNISDKDAFDLSREGFLKSYHIEIIGDKHNSLYDAKVIKTVSKIIEGEE